MLAITASSTCAVQTLLVALSRRMCCSRVCSAMRSAGAPVAVARDADDAARQVPLVLVARREEGGVRAAVAHRHAEALAVADGDVGAPFARAARAASGPAGRSPRSPARRRRARVSHEAVGSRGPRRRSRDTAPARRRRPARRLKVSGSRHDDRDAARLGPRAHHGDRLRMAVLVDQVDRRLLQRCSRPATGSSPRRPPSPRRAARRWRSAAPVRSDTIVWKLSSASSRPWAISA